MVLDELRRLAIAQTLFRPTTLRRAVAELGFVQADPIRAPARARSDAPAPRRGVPRRRSRTPLRAPRRRGRLLRQLRLRHEVAARAHAPASEREGARRRADVVRAATTTRQAPLRIRARATRCRSSGANTSSDGATSPSRTARSTAGSGTCPAARRGIAPSSARSTKSSIGCARSSGRDVGRRTNAGTSAAMARSWEGRLRPKRGLDPV